MSSICSVKPPYFGVSYYPEAWPSDELDRDLPWMKKANLNAVRMADFAWSALEPHEGDYQFDWLLKTVNRLGENGIATLLCTPTCTPPIWLSEKHPQVVVTRTDTGNKRQHGGRRHACPTSPVFRDYCTQIVHKMAAIFKDNPYLIGWQLDNEVYPLWRGCGCDNCKSHFHQYLKNNFKTVKNLNEQWNLNLWSMAYTRFDQVPAPRQDTWHHPSLLQAWMGAQIEGYVTALEMQADIIRQYSDLPIGTDMVPREGLNYYRTNEKLDVVQFNHYDTQENISRQSFWMNWCRPIKPRPFWCTETSTCWNGGGEEVKSKNYRDPGFCNVNTWLSYAMGAEANFYWLWRTHWAGQELQHGAVMDVCGRPMHIFDEVAKVGRDVQKVSDFLEQAPVAKPKIAMHFSGWATWMYEFQKIVDDLPYHESFLKHFQQPLAQNQFHMDMIDAPANLDPYQLIISPLFPCLEHADLAKRLKEWIKNGGTWIAGPLTDTRTSQATRFTHAPFGHLEAWTGIRCEYQMPGDTRHFDIQWPDGTLAPGTHWYDGLNANNCESLATYTQGPLKGLAAAVKSKMGKGQIIVLGTIPPAKQWVHMIKMFANELMLLPNIQASDNLLAVPRQGQTQSGYIVLEMQNRNGSLQLDQPSTDLLTQETFEQTIPMSPYQVRVLKHF